jgi:sigma-B regulation protein RsbU (phosphoserine phosphatase)
METDGAVITGAMAHEDQLRTLIKAFRLVSISLDLKETLHGILKAVQKLISYDAAGIYVFDPPTKSLRGFEIIGYESALTQSASSVCCGKGIIGRVLEREKGVVVSEVSRDPDYVRAREETRSEMAAPLIGSGEKAIGVINLESDLPNAYDHTDLQMLEMFASMVAIAIEKAELHKELLDKRRLESELMIAAQVMDRLMPGRPPDIKNFAVAGRSLASAAVGGDYYDFIELGGGRYGLVVADVSGKGVPAALIMASFRAYLHALLRNDFSLRAVFSRLNRLLLKGAEERHFVTSFYAELDAEERRIFYVNAGHNPPLLVRADGSSTQLSTGGIPLGIMTSATYSEDIAYFRRGDVLVLYTDGITEAQNPDGRFFGLQRLEQIVRRCLNLPVQDICSAVYDEVMEYSDSEKTGDDMTIVVVQAI